MAGKRERDPLVRFDGVTKRFGAVNAVDRLSLDIHEGEFFALLGPSGCGKTTLMRLLAGFELPDEGRIMLAGEDLARVPPHQRPVNMMFQSYALFPHLTVEGNIAFGLKQDGLPRAEIDARVSEMLGIVKLSGLNTRKPHQLSGGQRQRVALARALVKRPRVLLLDEPLAALDKKLREETQFELMHLRERLNLAFVIVTHDQQEAMTVANRIGVMDRGKLVQVGTPMEIYEQPNSRWVTDFIGDVNLFAGRVTAIDEGIATVATADAGALRAPAADAQLNQNVWVAVRPEKIHVLRERPATGTGENMTAGVVADVGYLGDTSVYKVRLDSGFEMKAAAANLTRGTRRNIASGTRVTLAWPPDVTMVLTQ